MPSEAAVARVLARKKEDIRIKDEPVDDEPIDIPDSDDDQDGHVLEDEDGIQYYEDAGFRIKQIPMPTVVQRSLSDLYALSLTKYLKLSPEYQRGVVWDDGRASLLITSILQGYFIPPIIFNVISQSETIEGSSNKIMRHYRVCVDGKQRLTSLQRFMNGDIGISDMGSPPRKWYYCPPSVNGEDVVTHHNILPETTKQFFRNRTFCCYEYADLPGAVEENMFQLVQRGMPLTPAEKLRALSTKWAAYVKKTEKEYPQVVHLVKHSRGSSFRTIITMFCQILEVLSPSVARRGRNGGPARPALMSSPQTLLKLLQNDDSLNPGVNVLLKGVLDKFLELVKMSSEPSATEKLSKVKINRNSAFDPAPDYLTGRNVNHGKSFSPLEHLVASIIIAVHKATRSNEQLLDDIKDMRYYMRESHRDLRINMVCWTSAWDYIDNEMLKRRDGPGTLRHNGLGHERNAIMINDKDNEPVGAANGPRADDDSEEGGSVRATPSRRKRLAEKKKRQAALKSRHKRGRGSTSSRNSISTLGDNTKSPAEIGRANASRAARAAARSKAPNAASGMEGDNDVEANQELDMNKQPSKSDGVLKILNGDHAPMPVSLSRKRLVSISTDGAENLGKEIGPDGKKQKGSS